MTRGEMRVLRKYIGKLSWLATNTRPDLAKKQKQAILKEHEQDPGEDHGEGE